LRAWGEGWDPRDPQAARGAQMGQWVEVEVGRIAFRFPIRGEPLALGRVDGGMFDPRSALRAFGVGRFSERKR
jgi:hypothetical protein